MNSENSSSSTKVHFPLFDMSRSQKVNVCAGYLCKTMQWQGGNPQVSPMEELIFSSKTLVYIQRWMITDSEPKPVRPFLFELSVLSQID